MRLPNKILAVHAALTEAGIAHAFGGALALAWCTARARGTVDVDLNVFAAPGTAEAVLSGLPDGVRWTAADRARIERDGQVRLFWDETPLDVFFNTTPYHATLEGRVRWEPFAGRELPFLDCRDLAVFKAFFGRSQDWVDLEQMADAGTLDAEAVALVLAAYLGADDPRLERLRALDPRSS